MERKNTMKVTLIITDLTPEKYDDPEAVDVQLILDPPIEENHEPTLARRLGMEMDGLVREAQGGRPMGVETSSIYRYGLTRCLMLLAHPQLKILAAKWPEELRRRLFMALRAASWAREVNIRANEVRQEKADASQPEETLDAGTKVVIP